MVGLKTRISLDLPAPMVRFMEKAIRDRGCSLPLEGFFTCEVLDAPVLGAFDTERHKVSPSRFGCANCSELMWAQVILNAPHITNQTIASRTMVHESIHAFDHCRVKLDLASCKHLACTEIRAANLSTDCNFSEETNRGIYKLQGQQKVRERGLTPVFT